MAITAFFALSFAFIYQDDKLSENLHMICIYLANRMVKAVRDDCVRLLTVLYNRHTRLSIIYETILYSILYLNCGSQNRPFEGNFTVK